MIGLGVSRSDSANGQTDVTTYWYRIPLAIQIPIGNFTTWQPPISSESESNRSLNPIYWQKDAGRGALLKDAPLSAPRLRYKLTTQEKYYNEGRFFRRTDPWRRDLFLRTKEQSTFVPAPNQPIPAC